MVKEKSSLPLKKVGMTPPWDSAHFSPKSLEGFISTDTANTFAVFKDIAEIDSMRGDHKDWTQNIDAIDTLHIANLFDTSFIFPENPTVTEAYAYDDSFRDDTLFRNFYGNGLFTQENPCGTIYVISGQFLHPARWLRNGLKEREIVEAIGKPRARHPGFLCYLSRHEPTMAAGKKEDSANSAGDYNAYPVFEGVQFYFRSDSLFATVLQRSQPCH